MEFCERLTLITGIIGVLAFLMAIPPLINMWWGRPKLVIRFGEDDRQDEIYLIGEIYNKPITRKFLNFIKVSRQNANVFAVFKIEENGQSLFRSNVVRIKTNQNVASERVSLSPSILPASFMIAVVNKKTEQVLVGTNTGIDGQLLKSGEYTVKVEVVHDIKVHKAQRNFFVQNNYPFAYWG